MKKVILFIALAVSLSSCQRGCTAARRNWQSSSRSYHIEQYSGGKLIKQFDFSGILNNQEHSDGYYWYKGDTLFEVSGDIFVYSEN